MNFFSRTALRATLLLLSLSLCCGSAMSNTATALRKAPYLVFPGDPTTMQVLWQAPMTGLSTIEWGLDSDYTLGSEKTTEFGNNHQHTFIITDLIPGTMYFYRVEFEGTPYPGSFRAAPTPETQRVKFIAYGDTRTEPAAHDKVAGQILQTIEADPEFQSLMVFVGDLSSDGDSEEVFDNEFFSSEYSNIRQLMARIPYQSCMGNHEDSGVLFMKYFPYPFVGSRYWSFDYGPVHFVIVDQYENYSPGSEQYAWIQSDLEATTQPWRIVILHAPGWSAGGGHRNKKPVQQYLQPLFVEHGVSLVFGGHNHYYARAIVDGVQHLTTGGGGAPLYTPEPGSENIVVISKSYHFCRITIEGGHLEFEAVSGNEIIDAFTLESHPEGD